MKQRSTGIVLILFGGLLGWALGYIRVPYIDANASYTVGLIAGISTCALLFFGFRILKKDGRNTKRPKPYLYFSVLVLLSLAINLVLAYRLTSEKNNVADHEITLRDKDRTIDSLLQKNKFLLINEVLQRMEQKLARGEDLDSAINQLAALNQQLSPYRHSGSNQNLSSPERGQLFTFLFSLNLDTNTIDSIAAKISFAYADLNRAEFSNQYLKGVDLSYARLNNADLSGAELSHATFDGAQMTYANLNNTQAAQASFVRADVRWSEANSINLSSANLDGADFSNSQLQHANLQYATARWGGMTHANLHGANLNYSDLYGLDLQMSNLTRAKLYQTRLKATQLTNTELGQNRVDSGWFELLGPWKTYWSDEIKAHYMIEIDTTVQDTVAHFYLISRIE